MDPLLQWSRTDEVPPDRIVPQNGVNAFHTFMKGFNELGNEEYQKRNMLHYFLSQYPKEKHSELYDLFYNMQRRELDGSLNNDQFFNAYRQQQLNRRNQRMLTPPGGEWIRLKGSRGWGIGS